MLGIAIRIAQRMTIHSESALAKCTVFEAELRRRLWWALTLFDARISEISGHKCTTLDPSWNCRVPLSLNDSDLRPEMKKPPNIQRAPTDALFIVVRSELGDFIRHSKFHLEFTNPALKPIRDTQHEIIPESTKLETLEKAIEAKYLNFLDPEMPVHFFTICFTRLMFARWRLLQLHSTLSSPTEAQQEVLVSHSLDMLGYDTRIVTSPLICGFTWMPNLYFPFIAYMQLLLYLRKRPTGNQADKAWEIMSANYEAHIHTQIGPFVEPFVQMILLAWKAREAALQGPSIPPKIISLIRQKDTERTQSLKTADTKTEGGSFNNEANDSIMPISSDYDRHSLVHEIEGQDENMTRDSESYFLNICEQLLLDFDDLKESNWVGWDLGDNAGTGSDEFASF